jgi:predicted dehydrogenase
LTLGRRGAAMVPVEVPPFPDGADGGVAATGGVVRRFVEAIRPAGSMCASFEDGLRVQELIDAIRNADRRGPWPSPS